MSKLRHLPFLFVNVFANVFVGIVILLWFGLISTSEVYGQSRIPGEVFFLNGISEKVDFQKVMNEWRMQVVPEYVERGGIRRKARQNDSISYFVLYFEKDTLIYRRIVYDGTFQFMGAYVEGDVSVYRYFDLQTKLSMNPLAEISTGKEVLEKTLVTKGDEKWILPDSKRGRVQFFNDMMPDAPELVKEYEEGKHTWKAMLALVEKYNKREK